MERSGRWVLYFEAEQEDDLENTLFYSLSLSFLSQGVPATKKRLKIGYDDPFVSLLRQNALLCLSFRCIHHFGERAEER